MIRSKLHSSLIAAAGLLAGGQIARAEFPVEWTEHFFPRKHCAPNCAPQWGYHPTSWRPWNAAEADYQPRSLPASAEETSPPHAPYDVPLVPRGYPPMPAVPFDAARSRDQQRAEIFAPPPRRMTTHGSLPPSIPSHLAASRLEISREPARSPRDEFAASSRPSRISESMTRTTEPRGIELDANTTRNTIGPVTEASQRETPSSPPPILSRSTTRRVSLPPRHEPKTEASGGPVLPNVDRDDAPPATILPPQEAFDDDQPFGTPAPNESSPPNDSSRPQLPLIAPAFGHTDDTTAPLRTIGGPDAAPVIRDRIANPGIPPAPHYAGRNAVDPRTGARIGASSRAESNMGSTSPRTRATSDVWPPPTKDERAAATLDPADDPPLRLNVPAARPQRTLRPRGNSMKIQGPEQSSLDDRR